PKIEIHGRHFLVGCGAVARRCPVYRSVRCGSTECGRGRHETGRIRTLVPGWITVVACSAMVETVLFARSWRDAGAAGAASGRAVCLGHRVAGAGAHPRPLPQRWGRGARLRCWEEGRRRPARRSGGATAAPRATRPRAAGARGGGTVGAGGVRVTGGPDGADFVPAQVPTVPKEAAWWG